MTGAALMLPEPARTLWRTTGGSVRQGLDAIGDRNEYRLGGGTGSRCRVVVRLAADLLHRRAAVAHGDSAATLVRRGRSACAVEKACGQSGQRRSSPALRGSQCGQRR